MIKFMQPAHDGNYILLSLYLRSTRGQYMIAHLQHVHFEMKSSQYLHTRLNRCLYLHTAGNARVPGLVETP